MRHAAFLVFLTLLGAAHAHARIQRLTRKPCYNLCNNRPGRGTVAATGVTGERGLARGGFLKGMFLALSSISIRRKPAIATEQVEMDINTQRQRILDGIYSKDPEAGYTLEDTDKSFAFRTYNKLSGMGINALTGLPPPCTGGTYGEITREGVDTLAERLNLKGEPAKVFYDLGSGAGKAVLHFKTAGYAVESRGIEFSQSRHEAAEALKDYAISISDNNKLSSQLKKQVEFIQGDLREKDISEAEIVWTANLCFPSKVSAAMGKQLLEAPNLRAVASLDEIPGMEAKFRKTEIVLPQSWDSMDVYLYERK